MVAKVVARAMDADKVAETTITKRNCLPRVIQQKNGDSSRLSRKNLCKTFDWPMNNKQVKCPQLRLITIMRQATSQV